MAALSLPFADPVPAPAVFGAPALWRNLRAGSDMEWGGGAKIPADRARLGIGADCSCGEGRCLIPKRPVGRVEDTTIPVRGLSKGVQETPGRGWQQRRRFRHSAGCAWGDPRHSAPSKTAGGECQRRRRPCAIVRPHELSESIAIQTNPLALSTPVEAEACRLGRHCAIGSSRTCVLQESGQSIDCSWQCRRCRMHRAEASGAVLRNVYS
jgi:hypothetical protein